MSKTSLREARVALDAYFMLFGKFKELSLLMVIVRVEWNLCAWLVTY